MRKLITCIASEDKAKDAVQGVADTFGTQAIISYFARGFGRSSPLGRQTIGQQTEKVIISVIASKKQADDIFAYLYHAAGLDRPHGGIIYVTTINKAMISPPAKVETEDA